MIGWRVGSAGAAAARLSRASWQRKFYAIAGRVRPPYCGHAAAKQIRHFHGAAMVAAAKRDHAALAAGVLAGKRGALSRAITLVESTREDHRKEAQRMLDTVLAARREKELAEEAGTSPSGGGTFPNGSEGSFVDAPGESWAIFSTLCLFASGGE